MIWCVCAKVKSEEVQECNGHNITYTEDIMARTRKCYKPIDDPCFLKCLLVEANQVQHLGINYIQIILTSKTSHIQPYIDISCLNIDKLDKAGKPNKEKILKDLRKEILIHVSQRDLYWKGLESCFTDHGKTILKNKSE